MRRPELAQLFSRKDTGDGAFLDTYNTLTEFGRRISDFDVDQAKEAGAAELEAAQAQARIEHVSVVHRDDGGESGNGKSTGGDGFDSGDEDMMAADAQGSNGMGFEVVDANMSSNAEDDDPLADSMDDEEDDLANGDGDGELLDGASTTAAAERISASSNTLPCREIDAYWLQRQLSHHYPDATKSQQMAEQVLETLEAGIVIMDEQQADEAMDIDSDDDDVSEKASHSQAQYNVRAVENNLFLLLEVDASASSRAKSRSSTHCFTRRIHSASFTALGCDRPKLQSPLRPPQLRLRAPIAGGRYCSKLTATTRVATQVGGRQTGRERLRHRAEILGPLDREVLSAIAWPLRSRNWSSSESARRISAIRMIQVYLTRKTKPSTGRES